MKLFRFPRTRLSDDEYIAKLRRSITWFDRWRFWFILFHVGLLVAATSLFTKVILVLARLAQPANAPIVLLGFIAGATLGTGFGWMIYGILHGLTSAFCGFRCERLLLKHYGALNSEREGKEPLELETDFGELDERGGMSREA